MRAAKRRRGVSYIEVLGALLILGFGLLSLAPLFALGVKVNASSRDLSTANALAREKLEQLIGYPSTDPRLSIPAGATVADGTNNTRCLNDLPKWYKPSTGETSTQPTIPGAGWFSYPCTRTYTVQAFPLTLAAPIISTTTDESVYNTGTTSPYYAVKLVTVTVLPTGAPLPGLRATRQSAYVRFRNAS